MALPGELRGLHPTTRCPGCGRATPLRVLRSGAGYYLGYACCEPISRESGYYPSAAAAQRDLDAWQDHGTTPPTLRDTHYHGR